MSQLSTTISAVTVYPDRARVTRRGEIRLDTGPQTLEISELPPQLIPDSLRAIARGSATARLLGVQVQRTFYQDTPVEMARELEKQIEIIQDEITHLENRAELVQQNRVALDALAGHSETYALALASGEMSVDSQISIFDELRTRAEKLDAERESLAVEQRVKNKKLNKLMHELDQQRSTRPRERYTANIEIEVLEAGELTIELSYVVSGTNWKPLYDLRLVEDEGDTKLEIGYLAQVTQNTAEVWEDVSLTISTARPALSGILPELDPWYIAPLPPPMPRSAAVPVAEAAAPAQFRAKSAKMDFADAEPQAQVEIVTATVNTSGAAITYQIPNPVSIPPDGAAHKVAIAYFSLPPKLDYVITPKLIEVAYRRALVINASPYTLLAGSASLFVNDEFIGATKLDLTAPQGEIELYLGADERIKVEREMKRRDVDKRLISGKRRLIYGYEIKLENLLANSTKLTLHDQIPAARHEDIKIKLESAEPEPTQKSELNLLAWEIVIGSKEKKLVRFDFSVEYPQEMQVAGLP